MHRAVFSLTTVNTFQQSLLTLHDVFNDGCACVCVCLFLLRSALPRSPIWSRCLNICGCVTCVQSSWTGTRNSLSVWNAAGVTKEKSVRLVMHGNIVRCDFYSSVHNRLLRHIAFRPSVHYLSVRPSVC